MSASASKSSADTSTISTDNRVAADNGSIVLGQGATLETLSDDVALSALQTAGSVAETGLSTAARLSETSAEVAKTVNADSLDFAGNVIDTASSLLARQIKSVDTATENAAATSKTAIEQVVRNAADPTNTTLQDVAKYAAIGGVALAAVWLLKKK